MNGEDGGAWGRAWSRARARFEGFTQLPGAVLISGIASTVLILGAMLPWSDYGGPEESGSYLLGVEGLPGALTVAIGVVAIVLLTRIARERKAVDSGPVASLGLLAVVLVAVEGFHLWDESFPSVAWGIFVSGAAAVLLLLGGFLLLGGRDGAPPPD